MPDTRPRRVTPEPVAQESNLGDILARAGVVPFNPNVGGADINSVIQGLLTPQPTPQPQAQPLLQQILQNLAGGISVATSRDPGAALGQQLQNQQALRFQREQYAREQSDKMNQIRQQFGLSLLNNQLEDQRQTARDNRLFDQKKEERIAEEQARIQQYNLEFSGREKLENISAENQKNLATLQHQWDVEKQGKVDARYEQERKQDLVLKKLDVKLGLVKSGLPVGVSTSITDKWFNDEKLTPAEEKALTAAAQRALRQATNVGRSSSSSGTQNSGGLGDKDIGIILRQAINDQYFEVNQNGKKVIVEVGALPKDFNGNPIISRDVRPLSKEENAQYAATVVIPALRAGMAQANGKPSNVLSNATVKNPNAPLPPQAKANEYDKQFQQFLKQGYPPEAIANQLRAFGEVQAPEDKVIIDGVIQKYTKNKKK